MLGTLTLGSDDPAVGSPQPTPCSRRRTPPASTRLTRPSPRKTIAKRQGAARTGARVVRAGFRSARGRQACRHRGSSARAATATRFAADLVRGAARRRAEGRRDRGDRATSTSRLPFWAAGPEHLVRHFAGLGAAARGDRPCHHLRRHGRHQHGAWRDGDARRLHDLRRAGGRSAPSRPACSTGRWRSRCRSPSSSPALVGLAIERGIIRFLYGRPLETLLATWGVSLILQQAVRTIFGPTNREVGNPSWMSGSFDLGQLSITWNRLWILVFALGVFAAAALSS